MKGSRIWAQALLAASLIACWACGRGRPYGNLSQAQGFQSIEKEFDEASRKLGKACIAAKTDADRSKLVMQSPNGEKYSERILELVKRNPKDPSAVEPLIWVITHAPQAAAGHQAMDLMERYHIGSSQLGRICMSLAFARSEESERLLRSMLEKNPDREVQGQACLSLGRLLREKTPAEAGRFLELTVEKYADIKSGRATLGDDARAEMFEMRNLDIGKVAPEIEGQDVDGEAFRLTEQRSKVVVLDFWGDW